jgi:hypothetical protein
VSCGKRFHFCDGAVFLHITRDDGGHPFRTLTEAGLFEHAPDGTGNGDVG